MTSTEEELEQLRQKTEVGTRAQAQEPSDEGNALEDTIVELLADVESGQVSKTLSVRDAGLTALIRALEETGELDGVGVALNETLGREPPTDTVDRSEVLRLAIRAGLEESAPGVIEAARKANARHASKQF